MTEEEELTAIRQRAVLALSVYNAISYACRDLSVDEIVTKLRRVWSPAWDAVDSVVTYSSVVDALDGLASFVDRQGELCRMPRRSNGLGLVQLHLDVSRTLLVRGD